MRRRLLIAGALTAIFAVSALSSQSSYAQGGGGPGGPGSGTGGGQYHHVLAPGGDPFALASDHDCDAAAQRTAEPWLEMLRRYVRAYEAHKPLPATPGYTITAHPEAAGSKVPYWLDIEPKDLPKLIASGDITRYFACSYITTLGPRFERDRGIKTPDRFFLGYAPGTGIFSSRRR